MKRFDCIVLGGGAAGLMCAAEAGKLGKRVAVLDHANRVGKKILMSGGGRCNFTNYYAEPANYISGNPHFCKSALKRYTQYDFLQLVQKYNLAFHEKTLGQLFCDHKAQDILDILLAECEANGVEIVCRCTVESIEHSFGESHRQFTINTTQGGFNSRSLVVATGGLSIPTMGASGFGYDIAKQFGLTVTPLQASLVPFIFNQPFLDTCKELAGVALPVRASCEKTSFVEALLFTHRGISGPAILQISNYWQAGKVVELDFLPDIALIECVKQWQQEKSNVLLKNLLSRLMPKKFVQIWLDIHGWQDVTLQQLQGAKLEEFGDLFHHWQCIPLGTEGYRTAEVTLGGVDTDQISSKTFEAKTVPGLFFVGEVLDVTGWLGGFNFQWAWSSGYCAAQYV